MEIAVNELPTSLWIRPTNKIPCFTITEAAHFLGKDADNISRLRNQLKGAAQRRLIHPRQKRGAAITSPAYFGPDDLAAAVVLFTLFDFGVSDAEMANNTSSACYHWDSFNPRPPYIPEYISPITAALIGAGRGDMWVYTLSDFYCDQTNKRAIVATVSDMDAPPSHPSQYLPPSFLARSTLTIQLAPILFPLNRVFGKRKGH